MSKWLQSLVMGIGLWGGTAYADFLPPEQAFQFQAVSMTKSGAQFQWNIAEGYYLYQDKFQITDQNIPLALELPAAREKNDPNFGLTQVYYQRVSIPVEVQPNRTYSVQWQGCAESGLCYPLQKTTVETDASGLIATRPSTSQSQLRNVLKQRQEVGLQDASPQHEQVSILEGNGTSSFEQKKSESQLSAQWNNDQFFLKLLSEQHLLTNLLVFLGLGILLACLPCSLPLIPILSSILVQQHRGYKSALIALVFVLGMATVYAFIGLAVAQLGYSFQRWFQGPVFITLFSLLFIGFALNLFGLFQLSLPQGLLQRLDRWQQKQKGGTLLGAGLMGMLAALIVGPCMSAPLAGALLFVSQLDQPLMGAGYLFVLGLGIGVPLFIAAVFGSHYLPQPGLWMDRLKSSFGFVMLALAVYFARPLMPTTLYLALFAMVLLGLAVYILWRLLPHTQHSVLKGVLMLISIALGYSGITHITQAWQQSQVSQATTHLQWYKVHTAVQLEQLLAQHPNQPVLIDVYADWCVACQPIEKEVIPRSDVQTALQDMIRIKLDLTEHHQSQELILQQWQILGPPTFIFLDPQHQEQRHLRLTGTFGARQLLNRLEALD